MAALAAIAIYTLLVGAESAVVRAALMGGLALFARQVGRRQQGLNSLAVVAALIALVDPYVLWDVGFQLSFAATLPVIVYHFQRLSLTSLIANPIILPAQPAVMILAVLLGMVYNPLG